MTSFVRKQKQHIVFRILIWAMMISFSSSLIAPQLAYARTALLPAPGVLVTPSPVFTPPIMTGMRLDRTDPLHIDFLIDRGDQLVSGDHFQAESQKLINYFFAALTVPEDQMWVNLSPYEQNRIIAEPLSYTAMGRDMLAQDYLLKQLSASLMYPEDELGREFWSRVHRKAHSEFGTTDIPMNTFNKIWIVPDQAVVFVNEGHVFVSESRLRVMLEEDYLALKHHSALEGSEAGKDIVSGVSSEIVKEVLIPEIEREINTGENFAPLRQMYHSLILAAWYKKNLRQSILGQVYVDQNKIDGVESGDVDVKEKIYAQYMSAFKKGVFNYIREDVDPVTRQSVPRKYFSGGLDMAQLSDEKLQEGLSPALIEQARTRSFAAVSTYAGLRDTDGAMVSAKPDHLRVVVEDGESVANPVDQSLRLEIQTRIFRQGGDTAAADWVTDQNVLDARKYTDEVGGYSVRVSFDNQSIIITPREVESIPSREEVRFDIERRIVEQGGDMGLFSQIDEEDITMAQFLLETSGAYAVKVHHTNFTVDIVAVDEAMLSDYIVPAENLATYEPLRPIVGIVTEIEISDGQVAVKATTARVQHQAWADEIKRQLELVLERLSIKDDPQPGSYQIRFNLTTDTIDTRKKITTTSLLLSPDGNVPVVDANPYRKTLIVHPYFFDMESDQDKQVALGRELVKVIASDLIEDSDAYQAAVTSMTARINDIQSPGTQRSDSYEIRQIQAATFARDIRFQRNSRSGLDEALPNVSAREKDLLLAVTQFLEIYSSSEGRTRFDGIEARRELAENPEIAEAFLKYLKDDKNEEYIDTLIRQSDTNWLKVLFARGIKQVQSTTVNLVNPVDNDPVGVVFDGYGLTRDFQVKELVFFYRPGYFYALTQIVDHEETVTEMVQGGIRYKIPLSMDADGFEEPSDTVALEFFESAFDEVDLISRSKYARNVAAQTYAGGAKTLMVVHPGAEGIKPELLEGLARSMVDVGLASKYLIGTESGLSSSEQELIAHTIEKRYVQHLQAELNAIKRHTGNEDLTQINPVDYAGLLFEIESADPDNLSYIQNPLINHLREHVIASAWLGQQNGGTSIVQLFGSRLKDDISRIIGASATGSLSRGDEVSIQEWALPAFSAAMSIERIMQELESRPDFNEMDRSQMKVGVMGAAMGANLALLLRRAGYSVVAIKDINGTVYKPEGFTVSELQELNASELIGRNVLEWLPEEEGVVYHWSDDAIMDQSVVDLDVLVSAARGLQLTQENIESLRGREDAKDRNPLVFIEAGFNAFEGLDDELDERGIMAFKATTIGLGGAYATYLEDYIRHKFTEDELKKIIFRSKNEHIGDVVSSSDTQINERIVVTNQNGTRQVGEIVLSNGKVEFSSIDDIALRLSLTISGNVIHSQGIDIGYRVKSMKRTIMWGNKTVVMNREGEILESNHPDLQVGETYEYINPLDELKTTAYSDIYGIAYRVNTMVMELVNRGMTPTEAAQRVIDVISNTKHRFESMNEGPIAEAVASIVDHLKNKGFYFPSYIAKKIAVKRMVAASDLQIELDGKTYVFNKEGRLEERMPATVRSELNRIDMKAARTGSFAGALSQLDSARRARKILKSSDLGQRFDRQEGDMVIPEAAPVAPETSSKASRGSIEEAGIKRQPKKVLEASPQAMEYLKDQRFQKMERSGLSEVLPDVPLQKLDILLGVSQFLEMLSHYEKNRLDGELFNGIQARVELVQNPDIARAFIDYLEGDVDEKSVLEMIASVEQGWLEDFFKRGIQSVRRTTAETVLRQDGDPIGIWFDGARLTGFEMRKVIVFVYSPDRFYGITQLVDISTAEDSKGGVRNSSPQARGDKTIDDSAYEIFTGAYEDANNLSTSQYSKNVLAGLHFAGGKTVVGISQDALSLKDEHFAKWAEAIVDILLMDNYVAGPDVGMSPTDMELIIGRITQRYVDHLKNEIKEMRASGVKVEKLSSLAEYGRELRKIESRLGRKFLNGALINEMRKRLLLALPRGGVNGSFIIEKVFNQNLVEEIQKIIGSGATGGSSRVGALSHVALAVTGHGAVISNETQLEYMGIDPQDVRVTIVGAGDVGGSQALKFARRGYKVVAISDVNGGVYKPEGFSVKELLDLNNIQPGDRNVLEWMPASDEVQHIVARKDPGDTDPNVIVGNIMDFRIVPSDLLVPAAMGGLIHGDKFNAEGERIHGSIYMLPIHRGDLFDDYTAIPVSDLGLDLDEDNFEEALQLAISRADQEKARGVPFMIDEGGNNGFIHMEELLHKLGIFAGSGAVNNPGGVIASTTEDLLKHKATVRELREIVLRSGETTVSTDVNAEVNEVLDLYDTDGANKLGRVILHNGFVVGSDVDDIRVRANLDPIDGKLYHRGDELPYRVGRIERQVLWGNYRVVLNEQGRVLSSNHPEVPFDGVFEFADPLDEIKVGLYETIEENIRRNKIMVMELYTAKGLNPTEAGVILANARGNRKAEIYEARDKAGVDKDERQLARDRDRLVRKMRKDGYLIAEHVAKNIAAMKIALESELSVVVGDKRLTFGPQGRIIQEVDADQAMVAALSQRLIVASYQALMQARLAEKEWMTPALSTLAKSRKNLYSFKKTRGEAKVKQVIVYAMDTSTFMETPQHREDFDYLRKFLEHFIEGFNAQSQAKFELQVDTDITFYEKSETTGEWTEGVYNVMSLKPARSGFLNYLAGFALDTYLEEIDAAFGLATEAYRVFHAIQKQSITPQNITSEQIQSLVKWLTSYPAPLSNINYLEWIVAQNPNEDIRQQAAAAMDTVYENLNAQGRQDALSYYQKSADKFKREGNDDIGNRLQGHVDRFKAITSKPGNNLLQIDKVVDEAMGSDWKNITVDSAMSGEENANKTKRKYLPRMTRRRVILIGGVGLVVLMAPWLVNEFTGTDELEKYGDPRVSTVPPPFIINRWEQYQTFVEEALADPTVSQDERLRLMVSEARHIPTDSFLDSDEVSLFNSSSALRARISGAHLNVQLDMELIGDLRELEAVDPGFGYLANAILLRSASVFEDISFNQDRLRIVAELESRVDQLSDEDFTLYIGLLVDLEMIAMYQKLKYLNEVWEGQAIEELQRLNAQLNSENFQSVRAEIEETMRFLGVYKVHEGYELVHSELGEHASLHALTFAAVTSETLDQRSVSRLNQVIVARGWSGPNFTQKMQVGEYLDEPTLLRGLLFLTDSRIRSPGAYFQQQRRDRAMISDDEALGGIDFNMNNAELTETGSRFEFDVAPETLQGIQPEMIKGVVPVIINVQPLPTLFPLLGLNRDGTLKTVEGRPDYDEGEIDLLSEARSEWLWHESLAA